MAREIFWIHFGDLVSKTRAVTDRYTTCFAMIKVRSSELQTHRTQHIMVTVIKNVSLAPATKMHDGWCQFIVPVHLSPQCRDLPAQCDNWTNFSLYNMTTYLNFCCLLTKRHAYDVRLLWKVCLLFSKLYTCPLVRSYRLCRLLPYCRRYIAHWQTRLTVTVTSTRTVRCSSNSAIA